MRSAIGSVGSDGGESQRASLTIWLLTSSAPLVTTGKKKWEREGQGKIMSLRQGNKDWHQFWSALVVEFVSFVAHSSPKVRKSELLKNT